MITFDETKAGYLALWNKARVTMRPTAIADRIRTNKDRYQAIEKTTGVPWDLIAALHYRESDLDFSTYLGNGQPLNKVTTEVPHDKGPFSTFEAGASDALSGMSSITEWPIERKLYEAERYNGEGYFTHDINSPYVWSWTDQYTIGKFIADSEFSATAVDHQCGVAAILKELQTSSSVATTTPTTTPSAQDTVMNIFTIFTMLPTILADIQKYWPVFQASLAAVQALEKDLGNAAAIQATVNHVTPGQPNAPQLNG